MENCTSNTSSLLVQGYEVSFLVIDEAAPFTEDDVARLEAIYGRPDEVEVKLYTVDPRWTDEERQVPFALYFPYHQYLWFADCAFKRQWTRRVPLERIEAEARDGRECAALTAEWMKARQDFLEQREEVSKDEAALWAEYVHWKVNAFGRVPRGVQRRRRQWQLAMERECPHTVFCDWD